MRQWTASSLVRVMAYRIFNMNEPRLNACLLDPLESNQSPNIWKCRPQKSTILFASIGLHTSWHSYEYMRTLLPESGSSCRDKYLHPIVFCGMQQASLTNAGAPLGLSRTSGGLEQIAIDAICFWTLNVMSMLHIAALWYFDISVIYPQGFHKSHIYYNTPMFYI